MSLVTKRIEAVIRRERVSDVKLALAEVPHQDFTACDTAEHDPKSETVVQYRCTSCVVDMTPRVRISFLVDDDVAVIAVRSILGAARTGREGDGTVVVSPVEEVLDISSAAVLT